MPKRTKDEYASDDGFIEADNAPKKSKSKSTAPSSKDPSSSNEPYWPLNGPGTRRVTVSEYKGKTMIGIREFYEKDGQTLPGKKGISLPLEQYNALLAAIPGIESALSARGESVARVDYAAPASGEKEDADAKMEDGEGKANFEATSDEGEE